MKLHSAWIPALAAVLVCGSAHAASGTLIRDETLRTRASPSASVAARAARGTPLTIVARSGGWLQVRTARAQGWVRLLSVRTGAGSAGPGLGDVVGVATHRSNPSRVVAVAGVRGLDEEDLTKAKYDAEEIARLDGYAVSPERAASAARKEGLARVNVPELPKPVTQTERTSSPWSEQ